MANFKKFKVGNIYSVNSSNITSTNCWGYDSGTRYIQCTKKSVKNQYLAFREVEIEICYTSYHELAYYQYKVKEIQPGDWSGFVDNLDYVDYAEASDKEIAMLYTSPILTEDEAEDAGIDLVEESPYICYRIRAVEDLEFDYEDALRFSR